MARTDAVRRRRLIGAAALLCVAALAGCGNSRTPVPSVSRPLIPHGRRSFSAFGFPGDGFGLLVPTNWTNLANQISPPVVMIKASGAAVIAVSRYARTAPPPADAYELQQDESALIAAVKTRDAGFKLLSAQTRTLAGRPAIELDAIEQISGQLRHVISNHVFLAHSELVLEEYAPLKLFGLVDRAVFTRVTSSLTLLTLRSKT